MNATILLVDGHHGIYAWKTLAESTKLYHEDGTELSRDDIDGLKSEDFCEHLDWIGDVYVQALDGNLWRVEQDGDIWAVHPDAGWSEDEDCWLLE